MRTSRKNGGLHDRDRARWKGDRHQRVGAWVIGAVAVVVTTIVLGAVAFLVLGIAVSMVAFLVILIPAIAIVALLGSFLRSRRG
jgi:hypothetical protein